MRIVHWFGVALVATSCSLASAQSCCYQEVMGCAPQSCSQPITSTPVSSPVVYESYPTQSTVSTGEVIYESPSTTSCGCSPTVSYPSSTTSYASPVVYSTPTTSYPTSYGTTYPSESVVYEQPVSYNSSTSYASTPTVSTPVTSTPVSYGTPVSYASYSTSSSSSQRYRSSSPYQTVSYQSSTRTTPSGSFSSILSVVNQKRARAGLPALRYDPTLTSVAQRKSYYRASRRITGHDGTNMGGARVEGVGWGMGNQGGSNGFNTCYLYSNGYSSCGAAIAYDNSGRAYYTLLLR
ncbi:MAG: CAP domain-containing protein [Planctomycetota bacterium]